ncbi:hypothetical protein I316_04956 [Kwoniella heveanensis BCC8398]|uniref:Uncharacterized protein n=1 Tax=Kwoniella heveanensis BCC8398 TaxID=1296120 RepID=A0A1B9GQS9_9TREE|nr:hypothetical protein I316_04956 [Kwoniella heveanensis BCC8398]
MSIPDGIQHDNVASSSRVPSGSGISTNGQNAVARGRSENRTKGKGRECNNVHENGVGVGGGVATDRDAGLRSPPPRSDRGDISLRTLSPGSVGTSAREGGGGSTARRVRTVPPSAIYDPPTPPSPAHSPLPHPNPEPSSSSVVSPRRPRQRLRYSSSSDSSADTDDEDDSEDDEPPWWTFTQRGMAKLRAKSMHKSGRDSHRDIEQGVTGTGTGTGGVPVSGEDSAKEEVTIPSNRHRISAAFLPSSRRSSKDKDGMGSAPSSIKNFIGGGSGQRQNTESPASLTPSKLLQPAPIRFSNTTQNLFRRSIVRHDSPPILEGVVHPGGGGGPTVMQRTKSAPTRPASAPTSPTIEAPSPGMTTLVDDRSSRFPSNEGNAPKLSMDGGESNNTRVVRRQLTSPNFPRFFRRNDSEDEPLEALTDTEVIHAAKDKTKSKSTLSKPVAIPGVSRSTSASAGIDMNNPNAFSGNPGDTTPDAGESTPTRPRNKRRATQMLRLNLPPPISQHFANGWPHAGSWQDALYGYYEEEPGSVPASKSRSRKSTKNESDPPLLPIGGTNASRNNDEDPSTPQRPDFSFTGPSDERTPTTAATGLTSGTAGTAGTGQSDGGDPSRRTKSRRQRKYRPAMAPPTPSGLGFTPRTRDEEGDGEPTEYPWAAGMRRGDIAGGLGEKGGFDWHSAVAQKELATASGGAQDADQDLARHDTIATQTGTHTSADSEQGGRKKGWWSLGGGGGGGRKKKTNEKKRRRKVDSDWRRRYRRMLFLDARVTIWLRLVNLAVVVVLLGLAVTIRLELYHLRLAGLIGSSTTMNISYSTLTILHVLTAIYREYFGKPIGLWGLRSKMLWVCLDLLFVGLWSSALTLSTNDLIATPLECTSGNAWWRAGLADEYAELLDELKLLSGTNGTSTTSIAEGVTHASHSLTITLPQMVISSSLAREACRRQAGCIALSLLALLLYGGNMVLSLFRIFETVRRTANVRQAVTF